MTTGKNGGGSRFLGAIASRLGIVETEVFQEGSQEVREYRGLGLRFRRKRVTSPETQAESVEVVYSPAPPLLISNGHAKFETNGHGPGGVHLPPGSGEGESDTPGSLANLASRLEETTPLLTLAAHAGSSDTPVPRLSSVTRDAEENRVTPARVRAALEPVLSSPPIASHQPVAPAEESAPAAPAEESAPEGPANGRHAILSGKTVAVVGFNAEEAARIGSALAAQYCSFLILSHEEAEFKKGSTSGCDLLIIHARAEWGEPGVLYPGSALKTKRPALIIGGKEALNAVALWAHGGPREFVPLPWTAEDTIWRAAMLLVRLDASKTRKGKRAGRKLVVIGDADSAASTLLHAVLAQEGIGCHVAENGVNTLALAKSKQADAVIVDVSLPGLDGFQVLAELKRDPAMSQTVIILLTARQAEADVLRGFGLGADDYITKPFSPMEVVARLKRFLTRKP